MVHPRTIAVASALAVVCGAAILWPVLKEELNQRKLAELARQSSARAGQGDSEAQYRLGSMYYYGRGLSQNYTEAVRGTVSAPGTESPMDNTRSVTVGGVRDGCPGRYCPFPSRAMRCTRSQGRVGPGGCALWRSCCPQWSPERVR